MVVRSEGTVRRMGGQGDVLAGTLAAFLGWGHARVKREQMEQQQQQQHGHQQQHQDWIVAAAAAACHVVRSAACMATASVPSPRHVRETFVVVLLHILLDPPLPRHFFFFPHFYVASACHNRWYNEAFAKSRGCICRWW